MWPFSKKPKPYLTEDEKRLIAEAIGNAEKQTSGEIRVYVEGKCTAGNPLDRAMQLFGELKMFETKERNGVLVYIAVLDRKLAVYGDAGIHTKVGDDFWNDSVKKMIAVYSSENTITRGIIDVVIEIGAALKLHFPYDRESDINELPDEVIVNN
jgi:uncharacterized membrane protein